jgi:dienelactone hydrolase
MACQPSAPARAPASPLADLPEPSRIQESPFEYDVAGTAFEGRFLAPRGRPIRAGLLFGPDWYGVYDYPIAEAKRFAALGFAVGVVDIYGAGVRPSNDAEAGRLFSELHADRLELRARVSAAHRQLLTRLPPGTKVCAFGFSMGGMTVLELARSGAELTGVVVLSGVLDHPGPSDAAAIRAPLLLLHGTDDAFAPMEQLLAFTRELDVASRNYRVELFGGAAHAFTNPRFRGITRGPLRYSASHAPRADASIVEFLTAIHPDPGLAPSSR